MLFESATATAPLTLPSHTSIFTGLLPPHHGVRDNGGFVLDPARTTLARRLQQAGFATGAFVGAWVLASRWGLDQGFDVYADRFDMSRVKVVSLGTVQKRGDAVMDEALAWLDSVRARRFFAWIHLYDPHAPYDPPQPFASHHPGYDGEVAYTDHVVGRLLSWLRAAGLWDRTVVALVADHGESLGEHGESLGEHGEATHAFFVYDATVHVPLVVRTPWGDHGRSRAQVSTVDLMPTLLDLMGLPPQDGIDGRSLLRLLLDPTAPAAGLAYSETYYPRFHYGWQHLRALRDGRFKYVDAPKPELYDVQQDPGETRDLHASQATEAERMRRALATIAGAGHQVAPERARLDPEMLQRLLALGYVGGGPRVEPEAMLADPKDKLALFARLGDARALGREQKYAAAVERMQAVIAEDPSVIDAHLALGDWLRRLGRRDEAVAALQRALGLQPHNETALQGLADLYRSEGRAEAAIETYRSVLRANPRHPQATYQLATVYLDLGRRAEAETEFREALEQDPRMGAAYRSLAALAFARGDLTEAERLVRRSLDLADDLRNSHFNLGRILEARGDGAGAEAQYREELLRFADNGRARFNLAQFLRQRGDRPGYLAELLASTEQAPEFGPAFFFLAREELDAGHLDRAADLATRGLRTDPASEVAPLGHYVLADVYNRQGRTAEASAEEAKARQLEAAARRPGRTPSPKVH